MMDNPLIFGYQLVGVKTFCMTRGVFKAAECWKSQFFSSQGEEGTPSASEGEVS